MSRFKTETPVETEGSRGVPSRTEQIPGSAKYVGVQQHLEVVGSQGLLSNVRVILFIIRFQSRMKIMKWMGGWYERMGGRAAEGREDASERAKRVSEPTIGMLFVMIITGGGGASERAKRVSEPN